LAACLSDISQPSKYNKIVVNIAITIFYPFSYLIIAGILAYKYYPNNDLTAIATTPKIAAITMPANVHPTVNQNPTAIGFANVTVPIFNLLLTFQRKLVFN